VTNVRFQAGCHCQRFDVNTERSLSRNTRLPEMKLCPHCEQDAVWRVRLHSAPDLHFSMCFECDSVWLEDQEMSDQTGTRFDKHMLSLGRVPDWKDIEKLGPVK